MRLIITPTRRPTELRRLRCDQLMEFAPLPPGSRDVEVPGEGFQVNFGIIRGSKQKN
jgi:hypothetical protein